MDREAGVPVVARRAALVVALAACGAGDDVIEIVPIIDQPTDDVDATATDLDAIKISVAHAGNASDLVSQTPSKGAPLTLPSIPFGDDLVLHMLGTRSSSSVAYGRSCAFTVAATSTSVQPHLFFSRTAKFASTRHSPELRQRGFGVSFGGRGIFAGGDEIPGASANIEIYDPATDAVSTLPGLGKHARGAAALVGSPVARVVVLGGAVRDDLPDGGIVEVFDDKAIEKLAFGDLARLDLTATTLSDGTVVAIGGLAKSVPSGEIDEVSFIPESSTTTVRKLAATLVTPRSSHSATRLGDGTGASVLIAGGLDKDGAALGTAELYKPLSETITSVTATMVVPRHDHVARLLPDGRLLIIGGLDAMNAPVRKLETFSFETGFQDAGELPANAGVIDMAATVLPDGRILLTGGRTALNGPGLDSAYIVRLDPNSGELAVVATDRMALLRAGHQAALLCDGTVLISGGTAVPLPIERYNPPDANRR